MRQLAAFILVIAAIGGVAYVVWLVVSEHGRKYGGEACGGAGDVKCPAGYECVDSGGKTIKFGDVGTCRFLIRF